MTQHTHYHKDISHLKTLDVYRVCQLFDVKSPAIQHAIKKTAVCRPARRQGL